MAAFQAAQTVELESIRQQQKKIERRLDEVQREQAERSFAHWRQTPDGKTYEQWKAQAKPLISTIFALERLWAQESNKFVDSNVSPEDKESKLTGDWTDPPRKLSVMKYVGMALGVLILLVTFFDITDTYPDGFAPIALIWLWTCVALLVGIPLFGRRIPRWQELNEEAKREASIARTNRLGADPYQIKPWPMNIWSQGEGRWAKYASSLIAQEVVHHPAPEDLTMISSLTFIPPDQIPFPELRETYWAIISQHVKKAN